MICRKYFKLTALLALILLCGCSGRGRKVSLEIVATSDVHGNLFPYDFLAERDAPCDGSLARVSTVLKTERRKYGANLLYLDAGDNLQGSPLTYQDKTADYGVSSVASRVLNDLGCDVVTFGNHDIEAGIQTLDRFITSFDGNAVCANLFYKDTHYTYADPYTIIERDGIRIAVVGMTTPYVACKLPASVLSELEVKSVEESSGILIPYIVSNEAPDLIVGLFHSGLEGGKTDDEFVENEARSTAVNVPGYDVIIYGHDHEAHVEKVADCNGDSVLLVNPGAYANSLARVSITLETVRDSVTDCSIEGFIQNVENEEADERLLTNHREKIDDVWQYLDSIVGCTDFDIDWTEAVCGPSYLTDYFNSVIFRSSSCEIALASPYDSPIHIPAGDVSIRDVIGLYPYENQITTLMLKGSDVVRILEGSSSRWMNTISNAGDTLLNIVRKDDGYVFKNRVFDFIAAAGINYTVDITKPAGSRIKVVSMSDGSPFDPEKRYRVGMSSFLASGGYSPFCDDLGMRGSELRGLELMSSSADMCFHIITNLAVNAENNEAVHQDRRGNWKLIPEKLAADALKHDVGLLNY